MLKAVMLYAKNEQCYLERVFSDSVRRKLEKTLDMLPTPVHEEELDRYARELEQVRVIVSTWWMPRLSASQIQRYFPRLELVLYGAGSVQYFARPYLELGVRVVSGWAANGVPVAEYTAAQILLANKGFFQNSIRMKSSYSEARAFSDSFAGNYGARVGILGAGMIGSKVIELLRPFCLEIWVCDPFLSGERAKKLGVQKHTLEEIFSSCDVISNHVAQLPETEGMLQYTHFSLMRPYTTLLNTGRGTQIVEADLVRALQEEPRRTAVLDVTQPEPPEADSPLWSLPNVVLTSHIAGSMGGEMARIGELIAGQAARYVQGQLPDCEITLEKLKTMA